VRTVGRLVVTAVLGIALYAASCGISVEAKEPYNGGYTAYEGRDLYGGDVATLKQVNFDSCVMGCREESQCKAYTYNKWKRSCFLKSEIGTLSLDPRSVTGVRKDIAAPAFATGKINMEPYPGTALLGVAYKSATLRGLLQCKKICHADKDCTAYTFEKNKRLCHLFRVVDNYKPDASADSGAKIQAPSAPVTASVKTSADLLNFERFKGKWTGSGWFTYSNGAQEQANCTIHVHPDGRPQRGGIDFECAAKTYAFSGRAFNITLNGAAANGSWESPMMGLSGPLSGSVTNTVFRATFNVEKENPLFSNYYVRLSVTVAGECDASAIASVESPLELKGISISLRRC
jgi:hypothetical protein